MLRRRCLETAGPTPSAASAHQDAGEAPAADSPQPTDSAPRAAPNAPRARTVTATRSWPMSELIVALMMSVLLHTAWFIVFIATAGFRPGPPWVVFAADPEAADEVVVGAPSPKTASVRTAPAVATREPASPPKPRPSRSLSAPSATSPPTPVPPIESGSPLDQLVARPADGERPSTPPASPHSSPIPPSEPVTRVSEPTPTPPAETVARIPEAPRETPAALTDLSTVSPAVSATPESESPSRSASARATATAAAPVLPPIPEPRPSRQMPALGLPTSDIVARAPLP